MVIFHHVDWLTLVLVFGHFKRRSPGMQKHSCHTTGVHVTQHSESHQREPPGFRGQPTVLRLERSLIPASKKMSDLSLDDLDMLMAVFRSSIHLDISILELKGDTQHNVQQVLLSLPLKRLGDLGCETIRF